jgi:ribosomal protein S19
MRIKKSVWKFPFNNYNYTYVKDKVKTLSRHVTLTTSYMNNVLKCHKGNIYGKLRVTKQHLGHKIGEFFLTKVLGERIAYRKKQKLLLKKNRNRTKLLKK